MRKDNSLPLEGVSYCCGFHAGYLPVDLREDIALEDVHYDRKFDATGEDVPCEEYNPAWIAECYEGLPPAEHVVDSSFPHLPGDIYSVDTEVDGLPLALYLLKNKIDVDVPCLAGHVPVEEYAVDYLYHHGNPGCKKTIVKHAGQASTPCVGMRRSAFYINERDVKLWSVRRPDNSKPARKLYRRNAVLNRHLRTEQSI